MKRAATLLVPLLFSATAYATATSDNDSTTTDSTVAPYRVDITPFEQVYSNVPLPDMNDLKRPKFISIKYDQGQMLKTNDFLKEEGRKLGYRAISAKFGIGVPGNSPM